MSGVGLEVLLEGLIPEIAYSGEKGMSITSLLKIVRQYHASLGNQDAASQANAAEDGQGAGQDATIERTFSEAEMTSARWAWDWLRSCPQILVNGNKRWNRLELSEVLALPEGAAEEGSALLAPQESQQPSTSTSNTPRKNDKSKNSRKTLTKRPRIYPSEDLIWQTLAHHGVDYKRIPVLEWKCMLGIATVRGEGILQSDLRRLVDQDKRSLPKRTDSLAKKGYIAKRTVVANKMKTSKLWLIDFAPPVPEDDKAGLDLSRETLTKNLDPVTWHSRWTGENVDVETHARTIIGIVKAWGVIRYCDLRSKMGVGGKSSQMKTLAKCSQRFVDMGVLKYAAAGLPGSRKVFKDCLKYVRDPRSEEWEKFLATGKKTSQYSDASRHREPKGNALALYGKPGQSSEEKGRDQNMAIRIFPGWTPEKPLFQNVFEVVKSAGPNGASNPQVSVATVGYSFRRYMASHLTKLAETQQPEHLKKFQVVSQLVRSGKTSAYMFSVPELEPPANQAPISQVGSAAEDLTNGSGSAYGFGTVRPKVFPQGKNLSLSELCDIARKKFPVSGRRGRGIPLPGGRYQPFPSLRSTVNATEPTPPPEVRDEARGDELKPSGGSGGRKRSLDEVDQPGRNLWNGDEPSASGATSDAAQQAVSSQQAAPTPLAGPPGAFIGAPRSLHPRGRGICRPTHSLVVIIRSERIRDPSFLNPPSAPSSDPVLADSENQVRAPLAHGTAVDAAAAATPVAVTPGAPSTAQDLTEEVDPPKEGPTRARGRGRGGKGRASAAGAKTWKCDKCGGTWKNDLGLKYHQTKAQTPCNPDFDPSSFVGPSRKKRKMSPPPPALVAAAAEAAAHPEAEGGTSHLKEAKRVKKAFSSVPVAQYSLVRNAVRSRPEPHRLFRGFALEEVGGKEGHRETPPVSGEVKALDWSMATNVVRPTLNATGWVAGASPSGEQERRFSSGAQIPKPVMTGYQSAQPVAVVAQGEGGVDVGAQLVNGSIPEQVHHPLTVPERPAMPAPVPVSHGHDDVPLYNASLYPLPRSVTPAQPPSQVAADNVQPQDEGLRTSSSPETSRIAPSGPYEQGNGNSLYPMIFEKDERNGVVDNTLTTRVPNVQSPARQPGTTKSFQPSAHYDRIPSEPKRRTAQALDIILYLLDNNCGVFPGDKALFYALTKVFLREFRGEVPPTWKNFHSAMKALDIRKLATVHTHMLRTEKGKLLTCTLLIRNDVDPAGMIPMVMKQKMRDAYPGIYIPPAFSPTREELDLLEELDGKSDTAGRANSGRERPAGTESDIRPNKNGQKFRSRRKIDEVEVFNAPYYTQGLYSNAGTNDEYAYENIDPMLMGVSEQENSPSASKQPVPVELTGSPSRRRSRTQEEPLAIDPALMSPSQNYRTPPGPEYLPPAFGRKKPGPSGKRVSKTNGAIPGSGIMSIEPQSVVDAIKTYRLLPPKHGKRRLDDDQGFGPRKLGKLPSKLGRTRNPGLSSLPESFYRYGPESQVSSASSKELRFLPPNTHLEDGIEDWGEGDHDVAVLSKKHSLGCSPGARHGGELEIEEPYRVMFSPPLILEDSSPGIWTSPDLKVFEDGGSFTTKGWMPSRAQLLRQNLPTSAEEMARRNPGHPWKTDAWLDQEWARYFTVVQRCKVWELSQLGTEVLVHGGSIAPNYIFINVSPSKKRASMKVVKPRWSDDRQFGLDTLPYELLEDDDDDDVLFPYNTSRKAGPKPPKKLAFDSRPLKRQRIARVTEKTMGMVRGNKFKLTSIKSGRELTSYPRSSQDFLRTLGAEAEDIDWKSENVRLTAFVVVTTLLGGVDRVVDWGLMMRLFPDLTISQLRHLWGTLKKDRQSTIANLTEKFRKAFLKAYADNELPPIDFNNVLAYDWESLIKWATGLDGEHREDIPSSRREVDERFILDGCKYENREWRESYYHMQRSVFNRFQDATSEALACAADELAVAATHSPEMVVALSWTRSLCVTPIDTYPTDLVIKRRESLYPKLPKMEITELILQGIDQLQREGVISRSTSKWSNGRRWRFNNRVPDLLDKIAQVDKLSMAVAFKRELDQAFRAGEKKRVTYITNDGMMIALINLQAAGRVRVETTGQPHVPMGHEPGNYETRKYTKKYLHFRLDIAPTQTYLFDDHPDLVAARQGLGAAEPPNEGPLGAIPVWCDVFGKVDAERWLKYLAAVLLTVASRGTMRADELVKTLKPTLMLFEAELVLEWAERIGLLESQVQGMALAAKEWWWLGVEAQKERFEAMGKPRKMLPSGRRGAENADTGEGNEYLF